MSAEQRMPWLKRQCYKKQPKHLKNHTTLKIIFRALNLVFKAFMDKCNIIVAAEILFNLYFSHTQSNCVLLKTDCLQYIYHITVLYYILTGLLTCD